MKLSQKIVDKVIAEVVGEDALSLVKALKGKKNVSEFKLTETIGRQINETRNILYRLYHQNLVMFTRKKDKKKGWYIYYWTFNPKRIKFLFIDMRKKRIEYLGERLERETQTHFYACQNKCMRLDFEQATNFSYKCPECGELMNLEDNVERIGAIKEEIKNLKKEVKSVE
ncbi:MAG: hypothetical protein V1735_05670 [Nanoarchaeota archaeon]